MPEFQIRNIMCPFDCRYGLGNKNDSLCRHLKPVHLENLAAELLEFELSQVEPSELFKSVQLYVDDPEFWSNCLGLGEKLHRHAPVWIQEAFIESTRHQLLRLSGAKMDNNNYRLFIKRIEQLMMLTSQCDMQFLLSDIDYCISNVTRANSF
ncbi:Oidioi.mRNA.OKI2018_I69.chr2.g6041.t1.cds [Oikopleura dioica]|uniref:Oidioi.mRNA.OKI2018_I69.chr2.g6041.t1.cds n=1 Tax=Oikopleura dioica TaxID=34765 RepID=A0ABN7T8S0_OIKDI|nr:Oidioi.mRNA.OKI2018_I69.chr2.g6041.t1.cds [Oikopleura dioica]